jgi:hypothetical protein
LLVSYSIGKKVAFSQWIDVLEISLLSNNHQYDVPQQYNQTAGNTNASGLKGTIDHMCLVFSRAL